MDCYPDDPYGQYVVYYERDIGMRALMVYDYGDQVFVHEERTGSSESDCQVGQEALRQLDAKPVYEPE